MKTRNGTARFYFKGKFMQAYDATLNENNELQIKDIHKQKRLNGCKMYFSEEHNAWLNCFSYDSVGVWYFVECLPKV